MTAETPPRNRPDAYGRLLDRVLALLRSWWHNDVTRDVGHGEVLLRIAAESSLTPRYIFMTCMSAGIAILGMLLSSPAVVIGAMLLSPLMGPILGAGFALAEGKFTWLRLCAQAIAVGTVVAILFCALIVWVSPLQTVTEEIAARTRPNLFDLLVAFFSSLAGSYAMIRGREGTIVGVAIATALMPPLAAVGFGLATWNMTVFGGALMLFVTNLLTIALTAMIMALLYGFRSTRSRRSGIFQSVGILITFTLLAIPLGLSLRQIAREANGQRIVSGAIADAFDPKSRINQLAIDWDAEPISITASVLTPEFRRNADAEIGRRLTSALGEDVAIEIDQFRVGTDPNAAEEAALAQARARERAAATEREIGVIADRMALVAGVEARSVVIDRENRRAQATARALPGLRLAGYRTLERRIAAEVPNWNVALRPPMLPLPSISIADNEPDSSGREALTLVRWAAARTGVGVRLEGPAGPIDDIAAILREDNIAATTVETEGSAVAVTWDIPGP